MQAAKQKQKNDSEIRTFRCVTISNKKSFLGWNLCIRSVLLRISQNSIGLVCPTGRNSLYAFYLFFLRTFYDFRTYWNTHIKFTREKNVHVWLSITLDFLEQKKKKNAQKHKRKTEYNFNLNKWTEPDHNILLIRNNNSLASIEFEFIWWTVTCQLKAICHAHTLFI